MPRATHITTDTPERVRRFSVATTIDGYEVIDSDGRPVSNSYEYANEPMAIAAQLNTALGHGRKSLARALARIEGQEVGLDLEDEDA